MIYQTIEDGECALNSVTHRKRLFLQKAQTENYSMSSSKIGKKNLETGHLIKVNVLGINHPDHNL